MADVKDSSFDIALATTDMQVTGLVPDGASPSGLKNIRIAIADFFSDLWTQINTNTSAITALAIRVTTLENSLSKTYDPARGIYTITQPAGSLMTYFGFTTITGTPLVKVGTTLGGFDIVPEREVDSSNFRGIGIDEYTPTARTIFVTITGGTCDVVTFSRLNLNSL